MYESVAAEMDYTTIDILITDGKTYLLRLEEVTLGVDLRHAETFVVLSYHSEIKVYAVLVSSVSLVTSEDGTRGKVDYDKMIGLIKASFAKSTYISYWFDFSDVGIRSDRFGGWQYLVKAPHLEEFVVMETVGDDTASFLFNLKYAKFTANSGPWAVADNVMCALTHILLSRPGTKDFTTEFLSELSNELREHVDISYDNFKLLSSQYRRK